MTQARSGEPQQREPLGAMRFRSTALPPWLASPRCGLTLDCSLRDTGDELLGTDDKHDEQWDDSNERRSHEHAVVGAVCRLELAQGYLQGQFAGIVEDDKGCLLYTSPSPRDGLLSRMPSSA